MSTTNFIRPIALCVFWQKDEILVFEEYHPQRDLFYYRPFGGGIEFGERHQEAVVREIREELNAEICCLQYLDCLENMFEINGRSHHELVFMYQAKFVDSSIYNLASPPAIEANGFQLKSMWKPLSSFDLETAPLFPNGLLDLLQTINQSD